MWSLRSHPQHQPWSVFGSSHTTCQRDARPGVSLTLGCQRGRAPGGGVQGEGKEREGEGKERKGGGERGGGERGGEGGGERGGEVGGERGSRKERE